MEKVVIIPEEKERVVRTLYTWHNVFFERIGDAPMTDLLYHIIPTYPDAVLYAATVPRYSPSEKKFQEEHFSMMINAKNVTHCNSPWSARSLLVPKGKDSVNLLVEGTLDFLIV
jgi:hypothetical protein